MAIILSRDPGRGIMPRRKPVPPGALLLGGGDDVSVGLIAEGI